MRDLVDLAVGLAWPAALFVALLLFRGELKGLLGRLLRIGREGAEFMPAHQPSGLANIARDAKSLVAPPEHPDVRVRPLINKLEAMSRRALDEAQRDHNVDREHALLRATANLAGALILERAYKFIFGSQIRAIEYVAGRPDGVPKEELRPFFNAAAVQFPAIYQNYTFDQWLTYLVNRELFVVDGDRLKITPEGQAFIPHITSAGYSLSLPG